MSSAPYNKHIADILHVLDLEAKNIQLHKRASRLKLVIEAVAVSAFFFVVMRYLIQGSLGLSLAIPAVISMSYLWGQMHLESYALNLQKRLPFSGIVEKIAIGPQELAKIYDHTLWPWSLLILGPHPRNLHGWILLVARNLDWYLTEPKLLIRLESVGYVLGWGLYIGFMLQRIAAPMDGPSSFGLIFLLVVPQWLFSTFGKQKRMIGAAMLRGYLKELMSSDKAGAPDTE